MVYKLLTLYVLSLLCIEAQTADRFSDKVNMKKFIREYWKIDRDKSNVETSKTNIIKLVKKCSDKYNVDLCTSDTIFILETCSVESITCYGSLWSKKGRVDFIFDKKMTFSTHNFWKLNETEVLFKWSRDVFKSLDEEGYSWLPANVRNATRIIVNDGIIDVDRIKYLH